MESNSRPSEEQMALLGDVIRRVARSRRLSPEDAEDFFQAVHVRLIERDYDVFHRFTGRSSLKTYLTVVVTRMLLDRLNTTYGKWRPSTTAMRLGSHAVALERLMGRDGMTPDEAVAVVANDLPAPSAGELRTIATRLPRRVPRRRVPETLLEHHRTVDFEDPLEVLHERRAKRAVVDALSHAVQSLPSEDRSLLRLRYERKMSVQGIAEVLRTDARPLYRRFERMLRELRRALTAVGVTGSNSLRA